MRTSGVLLPVFSLPSKYGIGSFSKEAYEFVDMLKRGGQKNWQILPLGPTGYGDSPYQSFSTYAGNPYFIDLEELIRRGLLTREECEACDFGEDPMYVDYEKMYHSRSSILFRAFSRFVPDEAYEEFVKENTFWLEDYSLYMAIKDENHGKCWNEWEEGLKDRDPESLNKKREELKDRIQFYQFQQYEFFTQWKKLKAYANKQGIRIIGDIPIYVAFDSSDTWADPGLFQFDEKNDPNAVAGCPPDAFSATGQLWGNPLYRWEYHEKTGYAWWLRRMRQCFRMYDIVRVDHFRGFEAYYAIPFGDATAENGRWKKGPGMKLFRKVKEELGEKDIIAEDLGYLTDDVVQLLKDAGYPGMKVLQFGFDPREESDYLPHTYGHHSVVYTGTHDNNTTLAWLDELDEESFTFACRYMNNEEHTKKEKVWDFIRMALASTADTAVIPIQDYLCLGEEARVNCPSTLGQNWKWRLLPGQIDEALLQKMKELAELYGRVEKASLQAEDKQIRKPEKNMMKTERIMNEGATTG